MALIGNGSVLLKSPGRFVGGVYPGGERAAAGDGSLSRLKARFMGEIAAPTSSVPSGYAPGRAWAPPLIAGAAKVAGGGDVAVTASGSITGGRNGVVAETITVTASALGGLVASLVALASIVVDGSATAAGAAAGQATASVAVTGAATAGALAHLEAAAAVAVTASAAPTGIGHMRAIATSYTELSVEGLTAALWGSLAASYNAPGTMGELLNAAGSGGLSSEFQTILRELSVLAGLDPTKPLVVTATSRTAGDIEQTIADTGSVTTVTRT